MKGKFMPVLLLCSQVRAQEQSQHAFSNRGKNFLLREHNDYRRSKLVKPFDNPSNMYKLIWDEPLAESAAEWARHLAEKEQCNLFRPTDASYPHGQNLANVMSRTWNSSTWEKRLLTQVMNEWARDQIEETYKALIDEKADLGTHFALGLNLANDYTQIISAKTRRLGCAHATCGYVTKIVVCEYDPPGNLPTSSSSTTKGFGAWYERGSPCSACDASDGCVDDFFCLDNKAGMLEEAKSPYAPNLTNIIVHHLGYVVMVGWFLLCFRLQLRLQADLEQSPKSS